MATTPKTLPRTYLLNHIRAMSGLVKPNTAVFYANDPNYTVSASDSCIIKLKYKVLRNLGIEESRYSYNAGVYTTDIVGNRTVNLNMTCEMYSKGLEASDMVDAIVLRMCRDSASTDRVTNGVSWIDIGPINDLPTSYDNRVVSVASCDFMFGVLGIDEEVTGTDADASVWIATVDTTNKIPGTIT